MDRRVFLGALTGSLLAAPFAAQAQQVGTVPRIGVLVPAEPQSPTEPNVMALRTALLDLGYREGENIVVEYRYAHGRPDLFPVLVAEFVRLNVDVMVIASEAPALAAKKATPSIPIVFIGAGDPIGTGLVASLKHPGGFAVAPSQISA